MISPPASVLSADDDRALRPAGGFRLLGVRHDWTDEQWDAFLEGRPEATFFHTRAWARIVLASFPQLRDQSIWFETSAGPCLLPLFAWRRAGGLLTSLHSSFPFLYGGPIPRQTPQGDDTLPATLDSLRRPLDSTWIFCHPLYSWPGADVVLASSAVPLSAGSRIPVNPAGCGAVVGSLRGFLRIETFTHLLKLPSSEEAYWEEGLSAAKRNDVRRLSKKGVVVEKARSAEVVNQLYRFYLESFPRWGGRPRVVYPGALYQNLLRLGGDAVRLTVARHEDRLLGGTFTVHYHGITHYLAGYFDHQERSLRPNVLIQIESIRRAIRDGCAVYDFLPSGGLSSVETFKESFGGERVTLPIYHHAGMLHRLLLRLRPPAPLAPLRVDG